MLMKECESFKRKLRIKFISYVRTDQFSKAYMTKNFFKAFFIIIGCIGFVIWGVDLIRSKYDEEWMLYAKIITFLLTPIGFLTALAIDVKFMREMMLIKKKRRVRILEKFRKFQSNKSPH